MPTGSSGGALGKRKRRISRIGGWPKNLLYSPLNWLVSADHDLDALIQLLARDGNMTLVGAPGKPMSINAFKLIVKRRSLSGSHRRDCRNAADAGFLRRASDHVACRGDRASGRKPVQRRGCDTVDSRFLT